MLTSPSSKHYFDREPFDDERENSNEVEDFNLFYNKGVLLSSEEDIYLQMRMKTTLQPS